jgi:hypothetical protein
MGWFGKREPDAVDKLCASLRDRYWEWEDINFKPVNDLQPVGLKHLTGIGLVWTNEYKDGHRWNWVYLNSEQGNYLPFSKTESERLWAAYQNHMVARVNSRKAEFGPTARALAQAVLNGNEEAALGLTDWVLEHLKGQQDG